MFLSLAYCYFMAMNQRTKARITTGQGKEHNIIFNPSDTTICLHKVTVTVFFQNTLQEKNAFRENFAISASYVTPFTHTKYDIIILSKETVI